MTRELLSLAWSGLGFLWQDVARLDRGPNNSLLFVLQEGSPNGSAGHGPNVN